MDTIARVAAPAPVDFERAFRSPSRPAVFTGLFDLPVLRETLSRTRLSRDLGELRLPVARMEGDALVVDAARGIVLEDRPFGDFVAAMGTPAADGYLMVRDDELPSAVRALLPVPRYCADAPWTVSRLWIAARDTVAVLHRDLADNLHTVFEGEKIFTLAAPADSARVYPRGLWSGMPNGARIDPEQLDFKVFPRAEHLRLHRVRVGPGETLFLPHGWWHHVRTARGTVSFNTWWVRGWRVALVAAADGFKRVRGVNR